MNHWQIEIMAEYRRKDIQAQMKHVRLEEEVALYAHPYHPGWFGRGMFSFANWMIATGGRLRHRYEIPAVDCGQISKHSFAR